MAPTLLLCDCLGTQKIDAEAVSSGCGMTCSKVHSGLCMDQINVVAEALNAGDVVVACGQEHQRFEDLAEELGMEAPLCVDIRDRAGWGAAEVTAPKMAALLAEGLVSVPAVKSIDVISEGTCLILGAPDVALPAAETLCETLGVTVLLTDPGEIPAGEGRFDIIRATLRKASGALGGFSVTLDAMQHVIPGGRGDAVLSDPRDGAVSQCDIILDLTGGTALFPAPHKREGYLRAEPGHAPSVAAVLFEASHLVGTFEKPLHVRLETSLCAHSRAEQPACSRCLDICPTGAIVSAGEHVAVDPMICAGCGGCSAVCPSGAISYDTPPVDALFRRLNTLISTYRKVAGTAPRLLVHDDTFGADMIRLAARHGRGLPGDVIPLGIEALSGFGHAEALAALAAGASGVYILLAPSSERDVLDGQLALANAIAGAPGVHLLDITDPDMLSETLYGSIPEPVQHAPMLPLGGRRQVTRLAARTLQPDAGVIDLPEGAPYGAVLVDTQACTLCLSCVSLCPSGALGDNPDLPQLRFQEDACLQCGLCANICPEDAISYAPRLNLADAALSQVVLHEEEPFACVECGTVFGVKSTVEKIMEKLSGKHAMFADSKAARMIQMCDNCRIQAQYHSENNPFTGAARPRVRTTDDYFSKRKDH